MTTNNKLMDELMTKFKSCLPLKTTDITKCKLNAECYD